jgi:hypothetical protein
VPAAADGLAGLAFELLERSGVEVELAPRSDSRLAADRA